MSQRLFPITDEGAKQAAAAGVPVKTSHQLRWMERTAAEKGLAAAFITIGRRKFLDPDKFHELVRQQPIRS